MRERHALSRAKMSSVRINKKDVFIGFLKHNAATARKSSISSPSSSLFKIINTVLLNTIKMLQKEVPKFKKKLSGGPAMTKQI